ncbi:MAG: hypothetical protein ABI634_10340 [Acidobacteriota bacterium]
MAGQRSDPTQRLGLALAVTVGLAAAATLARTPRVPMPSRPCAGLPELITFGLAHLTPTLPISFWMSWLDAGLLFCGIALTTRLAQRVAGSVFAGTAAGAALGAWVIAAPAFTLLFGAGPLMAVVAFSFLLDEPRDRRLHLAVTLAVVAAIWPSMTLACALVVILASRGVRPSNAAGLIGACAIGAVAAIVHWAASGAAPAVTLVSCLIPDRTLMLTTVSAAASSAGPYVCILAVFGAFSRRADIRLWPAMAVAVLVAGSLAVVQPPGPAVLAVLLCLAAAAGLSETARICRPGPGGRVAAVVLVVLVPILAWQSLLAATRPQVDARTFGHDRLSLALTRRIVAALPPDARVLSEDAVADVLIKTSSGPHLPIEVPEIAGALSRGSRVFALPLAQRELGQLGYRLDDLMGGVAEVHAGAECRGVTSEWRNVPDLDAVPAFTMVARTPAEAGPVVVYASFDVRPRLSADEWPAVAMRGFYTTVYDLGSAGDRAHLAQDVSDDKAPAERIGRERAFVARLELWRTPTAPLRLTVGWGFQPREVVARVIARSDPRRFMLCPTYPHVVRPFGP